MKPAYFSARALIGSDAAASIAEIAVLAPVFLLLLVCVIDMGRYARDSMLVTNAARAGAQYGARNPIVAADNQGMKTAALNDAQNIPGITATPAHFCKCPTGSASPCGPASCSGMQLLYVQVNTTGTYSSLIKYPGIPQTLTLKGQAILRVDQ